MGCYRWQSCNGFGWHPFHEKKQRARLKALRSVNDKSEYIHEHHMNIKVYIVTIPIGPRGSPQEFSGLQSTGNVMRCHVMSCHVMSYHFKTSQSSRHLGECSRFPSSVTKVSKMRVSIYIYLHCVFLLHWSEGYLGASYHPSRFSFLWATRAPQAQLRSPCLCTVTLRE